MRSSGTRIWEIGGSILRCGCCGWAMMPDRKRSSVKSSRYYHYYRCGTKMRYGGDACEQSATWRAEEREAEVWNAVFERLTDTEQLRADLEHTIELQRQGVRGDPDAEAKAWLNSLAETDSKRTRYQEIAAEGLITFDELRSKLAGLEEARKTAHIELESLKLRQEKLRELERDAEIILNSCVHMTPEALQTLSPEERRSFYKILRLEVLAQADGSLEIRGPFPERLVVRTTEAPSARR